MREASVRGSHPAASGCRLQCCSASVCHGVWLLFVSVFRGPGAWIWIAEKNRPRIQLREIPMVNARIPQANRCSGLAIIVADSLPGWQQSDVPSIGRNSSSRITSSHARLQLALAFRSRSMWPLLCRTRVAFAALSRLGSVCVELRTFCPTLSGATLSWMEYRTQRRWKFRQSFLSA